MSTYVNTAIAECPDCGGEYPGHVYRLDGVGVFAWTCPACDHTAEPSELDTRTVGISR